MSKLSVEQIQEDDNKYLLHPWSIQSKAPRTVIEKAEGIYIYDSDNKKYFDMVAQSINVNIGYGNQKVIQAIKDEMDHLPAIGPAFATETRSVLAKRILSLVSDRMGKVFFTQIGRASCRERVLRFV